MEAIKAVDVEGADEDMVLLSHLAFETLCLYQSASYELRRHILIAAKCPVMIPERFDEAFTYLLSNVTEETVEFLYELICTHISASRRVLH